MKTPGIQPTERRNWGGIVFLILLSTCLGALALDYLGAGGVLQQVRDRNARPAEKTAGTERSKFCDELKTFSQTVTNLAPAEAARAWLRLVDRAAKFQRQPIQADQLLGALPPPADWAELAKAIAARPPAKAGDELREAGLRLLAVTLTADTAGQKSEIAKLAETVRNGNQAAASMSRNYLEQIIQTLVASSNDPEAILKSLRQQLASDRGRGRQALSLPNLVVQVGSDKAGAFLREALVTPGVTLQFEQPNETSRLAQKLALELIDQLKQPQWGLVNSLDAVNLYEALDRRFGAKATAATTNAPASGLAGLLSSLPGLPDAGALNNDEDDNQKGAAKVYYFLGLIAKYRMDEAVAMAHKLDLQNSSYLFDEAFKGMLRGGYTHELDSFFHDLLAKDPTLPFWEQYFDIAAQAGQTDRMLDLLRAAIARRDLSDVKKAELHRYLFKALLAADQVDEGVQEMRAVLAAGDNEKLPGNLNRGQLGVMLTRIGILMEKPEWSEAGIAAARQWLAKATDNDGAQQHNEVATALAQALIDLKRGPEAEAVLTDALAEATRPATGQRFSSYYWQSSPASSVLARLGILYHQAGRPAEVLRLLDQSPDWGVRDVSELFDLNNDNDGVNLMWLHTGSSPIPVPYLAADALLAAGRTNEAQKIDDALLDHFPGLDRGYELLIALQGTNAYPKLTELFQRDQFEERPLIWQAHLLRSQNRLEEAEKVCRQAVAIDPSDGEEGRGDRMRVYAELAEIRAARGDAKEATFFREVVQAIRLSEDADQFYQAGLLKRAIGMYEKGLNHFADAYCIQSRLAIQLSALGLNEQAEEHYRRAYELMPDSFGRVESHCFGCERAFDGEHAQSIAEKVFTKIAAERPDKPQVHYLLGYLRLEQERFNEARTNYLTAVHLDPDYLNAWIKLQEVDRQTISPPGEQDEIIANILRLDPLSRHNSLNFDRAENLAGLWQAVAAAASHLPVAVTNLYELPASRLALEKKTAAASSGMDDDNPYTYQSWRQQRLDPAQAVANTPLVRVAGEMLSAQNFMGMD